MLLVSVCYWRVCAVGECVLLASVCCWLVSSTVGSLSYVSGRGPVQWGVSPM